MSSSTRRRFAAPLISRITASRFLEALAAGLILVTLPRLIAALPPDSFASDVAESVRIAAVFCVFGIFLAIGQPFVGFLCDRGVSRRKLAATGLAVTATTMLFFPLASTLLGVLSLRAVQGLAIALVVPTTVSLVAGAAREGRGRALGLFTSVRMVGFCVGPVLGGFLLEVVRVETVFSLAALLGFAACLPLVGCRDSSDRRQSPTPAPQPGRTATTHGSHRTDWRICLALGVGAFAASSLATSLVVLQNEYVRQFDGGSFALGLAISAMLVTRILLNGTAGRLSDRIGSPPVLMAGLGTLIVSAFFLIHVVSWTELILTRVSLGIGMALFSTAALAWVSERRSEASSNQRRDLKLSIVTTGFSLGMGAGPILTSVSASAWGLSAPFLIFGALALVVLLCLSVFSINKEVWLRMDRIQVPSRALASLLIACVALALSLTLPTSISAEDAPALVLRERHLGVMGTELHLKVYGKDPTVLEKALDEAILEMQRIENLMTDWRPSELTRINDAAGDRAIKAPIELLGIIDRGLALGELTGGAFDITYAGAGKLWNFKTKSPRIPKPGEIAKALDNIGWDRVHVDLEESMVDLPAGMQIGLGGIAKGYGVDRAMRVIMKHGIKHGMVNAGGDMKILGRQNGQSWEIALAHPRRKGYALAVLQLSNTCLVTSGDYERFFVKDGVRYHHIIDPRTGYPAQGCISATVVAQNAEYADAIATALCVLGPEKSLALVEKLPRVEAIMVGMDEEVHASTGLRSSVRPELLRETKERSIDKQ